MTEHLPSLRRKRGQEALYAMYPALAWSVIATSLPARLGNDSAAEAQWVHMMGQLNRKVIPPDATVVRRNRPGVTAIPHRGCSGYLGRVVALDECVIFSPLAEGGRHHDFEICRWAQPEPAECKLFGFRDAAKRASQIATHATCSSCREVVDLAPYRDEIRRVASSIHHRKARKPGTNVRRLESRVGRSASPTGASNATAKQFRPQPEGSRRSSLAQ